MGENKRNGIEQERSGVAVVVSGGGARGAYEAGVLSVLLPALEAAGNAPSIFLGTSAGAINAVGFASMAHLGAQASAEAGLKLWRDVRLSSVLRLPRGRGRRGGPRRAAGMLDAGPLVDTLSSVIDWGHLHENVAQGRVSVGVVATAWSTRRSAVFLERAPGVVWPRNDTGRSIDYVATSLTPRHVQASSAIPVAFPAVQINLPAAAADWYIDGGVRMNTPLKPALALGAKRVVVVATDPATAATPRKLPSPDWAPDLAGGAAQALYALLTDRMVEDLRTLARRNAQATPDSERGDDAIEWLFAGPEPGSFGPLAQMAADVLGGRAKHRRGPVVELLRRTVGRWVAGNEGRLELATHLLFDPEFIEAAIELGQRDARRSLDDLGRPVWHLSGPEP